MLNRLSLNRIGLNRIGLNRIGKPSGGSSDRPYIDPKVLDSLCGVWIMDQNTNESESRNIIKNKIADRGGDLELLNFAYKANSGYNGYPEDFTSWNTSSYNVEVSKDGSKVKSINNTRFALQYSYTAIGRDIPSFKVKISNLTEGYIKYFYRNEEGVEEVLTFFSTDIDESEIIELPKSYNTVENGTGIRGGFDSANANIGVTIEQLPLYEGALVTDGKDDMIVSQKTVQEMLGGSNVCTVVSMIHTISSANNSYEAAYTNCIIDIDSPNNIIRNNVGAIGKTGIYGYKCSNLNTQTTNTSIINNILGDKNDYGISAMGAFSSTSKFSVIGFGNGAGLSEVAVYWTFISNKVLTTDEINQIIGYFKLDKYVTPQVIYDVKRQGLTNDTPAADWYLKDFSGNGYDMQLYNYLQAENSGIGKYVENFLDKTKWGIVSGVSATKDTLKVTDKFNPRVDWIVFADSGTLNDINLEVSGIPEGGTFILSINANAKRVDLHNGFNSLKLDAIAVTTTTGYRILYGQDLDWSKLIITQIPDYEGALVSDGKDDYGKAEGLPILKDYTVAADYARLSYGNIDSAIISKSYVAGNGAFGFNLASGQSPNNVSAISFGTGSAKIQADDNYRKIRYQSKYVNDGVTINAGNGIDGNEMWLSCLRENYNFSESALYSMLLFPYSLSEFLLERQLKKYKLGTLYPNMVEFRPVISGNIPYDKIEISQGSTVLYTGATDKTGIYLQEGSTVRIYIRPSGVDEVSKITINGIEYTDLPINVNGYYYADFPITKSPQKISYVIDEYIRFEDIVQPYPAIVNLSQDGKSITWGDKLKVGSEVTFVNHINLLPEIYDASGRVLYNGFDINSWGAPIVVAKSMVFTNVHIWKLNTTEPHAIYSPQKLNIPNSSLKILGYVPDLTGKGNNGKLNNFAYTEDSGVAVDGSIKFDGTDDHITIPTLAHGGKCVMMKVNWSNDGMLYDQRPSGGHNTFGIYTGENHLAYSARNNGSTYIDGILNTNIIPSNLAGITHNITAVNDTATDNSTTSPRLGTSFTNATFSNMSLYEFMLFPEIPSEDEIKKLNDVMGIEGGYVESPNYYWDSFGKSNNQADDIDTILDGVIDPRTAILDKSVLGLKAIEDDDYSTMGDRMFSVKNVAYNSESGYGGKSPIAKFNKVFSDGNWNFVNERITFEVLDDGNSVRITETKSRVALFWTGVYNKKALYKVSGVSAGKGIKFGNDVSYVYSVIAETDGIYEVDWSLNLNASGSITNCCILTNGWIGECDIVIEQLYEYPNGLLLDGVEDHAVNTVIPAVTDYTWIMKREILGRSFCSVAYKGDGSTYLGGSMWFEQSGGGNGSCSFGSNFVGGLTFPKLISYQTKTSYNGTSINPGTDIDGTKLVIGARLDIQSYLDLVFYKAHVLHQNHRPTIY